MLRAAYVSISSALGYFCLSLLSCDVQHFMYPPKAHQLFSCSLSFQFAQELLSTFGPALGEVALQPATGGVFTVTIETAADTGAAAAAAVPFLLWDRKVEGGFPETKELKRRVRDVIAPGRNLGHVDRNYGGEKGAVAAAAESKAEAAPVPNPAKTESEDKKDPAAPFCEDCQ